MEIRHTHPDELPDLDPDGQRRRIQVENLFAPDAPR